MIEKLAKPAIEKLLKESVVGRIGCSYQEFTYVVPISYAYDGQYIYGHTQEGLKVDIMRKNPEVCFEVDNTLNMSNWQSVIAWGKYEELNDRSERKDAIEKLANRKLPMAASSTTRLTSGWPFYNGVESVEGILFRIKLEKKTGKFEVPDNHLQQNTQLL